MELYLLLVTVIPATIAFAVLHRTHRATAESSANLVSMTKQLYSANRTKDLFAKHVDELTANNIELQNEMNIAIGRLEHLDNILKTKTKANKLANAKVLSLHERVKHYARADVAHTDKAALMENLIHTKNKRIENLRNELTQLQKRLNR